MIEVEITQKGVYQGNDMLPVGHRMKVQAVGAALKNKCRVLTPDSAQFEVATPAKPEEPSKRDQLRERYKELTGQDAPGRMKDETLEAKIAELEKGDADSE